MGVGTGHQASCSCALCNNDEDYRDEDCADNSCPSGGHVAARGLALAGYGVPNGGVGDALVGGKTWATKSLTFGFLDDPAAYDQDPLRGGIQYGDGEPAAGFAQASAAQMAAAQAALAQIVAVSLLSFTRNDANADIRIAQSAAPASAWAYYPDSDLEGGDVWFGNTRGYYDDPVRGSYGWHAFLHELGHAVGLKHGHDHGAPVASGPLASNWDSMEWSVTTYRSYVNDPMIAGYSNESAGYAQSLMRVDIAALQQLYGANYDHLSGDTHYAWDPFTGELTIDGVGRGAPANSRVFEMIWDGGGIDTIDASAYNTGVSIDLAPGAGTVLSSHQLAWLNQKDRSDAPIHATANVYLAELNDGDVRGYIENAIGGAGDDTLTGNQADNVLSGGSGADELSGLAGSDTLSGEAGGDTLFGAGGKDELYGQAGADRLSGGNGKDKLVGGAGRDVLDGGRGRDKLSGGGGADDLSGGRGGDHLIGGAGADVFHFDNGGGADWIMDFSAARDRIDLSRLETDSDALHLRDVGQNVRIIVEGVSIMVMNAEVADFTADQFLF